MRLTSWMVDRTIENCRKFFVPGDPDRDAITKEIQDAIDEADKAFDKNTEAKLYVGLSKIYRKRKGRVFENKNHQCAATMQNDAVNAQLALNAAKEKRRVKAKYALRRLCGISDVTPALEMGPRTHYGSIANDIGHMRITDRRTKMAIKLCLLRLQSIGPASCVYAVTRKHRTGS